jgi:hypothetical protein
MCSLSPASNITAPVLIAARQFPAIDCKLVCSSGCTHPSQWKGGPPLPGARATAGEEVFEFLLTTGSDNVKGPHPKCSSNARPLRSCTM